EARGICFYLTSSTRPDTMKTPLTILALLILPSTLQAQDQPPPPPSDRAYSPKLVFTPNEFLKYHFVMNMNIGIKTSGSKPLPLPPGLGDMKMDTTLRMKTAGVKPDGSAVLAVSMIGGKMLVMGNSVDIPQGQTSTMEID